MSSKTTYLQLVKEDKSEAYSVDTVNANLDKIDRGFININTTLDNTNTKIDNIELIDKKIKLSDSVKGLLESTSAETLDVFLNDMISSFKESLSSIFQYTGGLNANIGSLQSLNTESKDSLVSAINEIIENMKALLAMVNSTNSMVNSNNAEFNELNKRFRKLNGGD